MLTFVPREKSHVMEETKNELDWIQDCIWIFWHYFIVLSYILSSVTQDVQEGTVGRSIKMKT